MTPRPLDVDLDEGPGPQTIHAKRVAEDSEQQRGRYTTIREIGKGTFGVAFLVKNKVRRESRFKHHAVEKTCPIPFEN